MKITASGDDLTFQCITAIIGGGSYPRITAFPKGHTFIMRKYRYYYFDEQNDDFANTGIKRKDLPEGYQYLPDDPLYKVAKPAVYYGAMPVASWLLRRGMKVRLINCGVLDRRREMQKGFFIYGNHTSYLTDALTAPIAAFPRQCYTVVSPDALSVGGIRTLVRLLGALPTPSGLKGYIGFKCAIEELYLSGNAIAVYPEAHIWPKYNAIRSFSSASFAPVVKLGAPCYAKTTIYKKLPSGRTHPIVIFDGPFYPDPSLPPAKAREALRDRIYATMVVRVNEYGSSPDSRRKYIRVASPDLVRTEVTRKKSR